MTDSEYRELAFASRLINRDSWIVGGYCVLAAVALALLSFNGSGPLNGDPAFASIAAMP
jgi:hypothetical protein